MLCLNVKAVDGLDGRLLTLSSLWLGYIVARRTCESNTSIEYQSSNLKIC